MNKLRDNWGHDILKEYYSSEFNKIYADLILRGNETSPRGQKVLEIQNYSYNLRPYVRFTNFKARNLNLDYIKKEFLWYLKGDRFDISITEHASMWKNLIDRDGGINSDYGQYIFGKENQFDNVVKTLTGDKDSRRAVIMILNSKHLFKDTQDVPCTYSISFRIRKNKLHMSVNMRSQDAIFGMSNDAPAFSMVHEMMYITMKEIYPELEYGTYNHKADSFHVYERHFKMIGDIIAKQLDFELIECPKISSMKEIQYLRNLHKSAITLGFPDKSLSDFKAPVAFQFTNWLIDK